MSLAGLISPGPRLNRPVFGPAAFANRKITGASPAADQTYRDRICSVAQNVQGVFDANEVTGIFGPGFQTLLGMPGIGSGDSHPVFIAPPGHPRAPMFLRIDFPHPNLGSSPPTWKSGQTYTARGLLTAPLSTAGLTSQILTQPQTTAAAAGQNIYVMDPTNQHTDAFVLASAVTVGDTKVQVSPQVASYAYPVGSYTAGAMLNFFIQACFESVPVPLGADFQTAFPNFYGGATFESTGTDHTLNIFDPWVKDPVSGLYVGEYWECWKVTHLINLGATSAIVSGSPASVAVNALAYAIPAGSYTINSTDGTNSETFVTTGAALGALSIPTSTTFAHTYPAGAIISAVGNQSTWTDVAHVLPPPGWVSPRGDGSFISCGNGAYLGPKAPQGMTPYALQQSGMLPDIPSGGGPWGASAVQWPQALGYITHDDLAKGKIEHSVGIFLNCGGPTFGKGAGAMIAPVTRGDSTGNFSTVHQQFGATSTNLSTGTPITSIPVTALPSGVNLPLASGSSITLRSGSNTQGLTTAAPANVGDVSVSIQSKTPTFAFPTGTALTVQTQLYQVPEGAVFRLRPDWPLPSAGDTFARTLPGGALKYPELVGASANPTAVIDAYHVMVWEAMRDYGFYARDQGSTLLAVAWDANSFGTPYARLSLAQYNAAVQKIAPNSNTLGASSGRRNFTSLVNPLYNGPWLKRAAGTLSSPLSIAGPIVSLPVAALPYAILALEVVTLDDGAGHTQDWTVTAQANVNATSITVTSQTPSFAFPSGTSVRQPVVQLVDWGSNPAPTWAP